MIWTFQDGDNESDYLMGLHPEFADWHTKVNLYEVRAAVTYEILLTFSKITTLNRCGVYDRIICDHSHSYIGNSLLPLLIRVS